jgi:DNA-binding transcriptional MerR regulator
MNFYNTQEVAKRFNVTGQCLKNWVNQYNLPHNKTNQGYYLFTDEDIEAIKQMLIKKYNLE